MIVWKKHRTIMEDILIVHFIAKTNTDGRGRFTGAVATARFWAELHRPVLHFVRPRIVDEGYFLARKQRIICCTIGRI